MKISPSSKIQLPIISSSKGFTVKNIAHNVCKEKFYKCLQKKLMSCLLRMPATLHLEIHAAMQAIVIILLREDTHKKSFLVIEPIRLDPPPPPPLFISLGNCLKWIENAEIFFVKPKY